MKKLILVRYGEHKDGHLNEQGAQAMVLVAEKLRYIVKNQNVSIISAKVDRAIESADTISKYLNISPIQAFSELYAAEEDGVVADLGTAMKTINSVGEKCDVIIAVVSKEYIEALPGHILKSLGSKKTVETHLNRGEILVLDYNTKDISYLR